MRADRYFQGFIDLLYQDAAGGWHILDFKTNVVTRENLDEVAANYEMQMLVYALAAEKILKCPPAGIVAAFPPHRRGFPFSWNEQARRRIVELVEQSCVSSRWIMQLVRVGWLAI